MSVATFPNDESGEEHFAKIQDRKTVVKRVKTLLSFEEYFSDVMVMVHSFLERF